jgi:predicted phosphodiesterase
MVALLATSYPQPIHVVFGNNDGDLFRITRNAAKFEHVHLHGEFFDGVFADRRIAVTHYPEIAGAIGSTGSGFDAVCYGHDHRLAIRREADTLWLNPGPIMGYDPIAAAEVPVTFIVYDTVGHQAQGYRVVEGAVVPV